MKGYRGAVSWGIGLFFAGILLGGTLDPKEFTERRRKVLEAMGDGGVLLLRDLPGTGADRFQGNRDFYYLTGITREGGALLLAPGGVRVRDREPGADYYDGKTYREILFLPETSDFDRRWDGPRLGPGAGARERSGIRDVLPAGKLPAILESALGDAKTLYFQPFPSAGPEAGDHPDRRLLRDLRERFFWVEMRRAAPLIHPLRVVKSPLELRSLQKAVDLTGEGVWEVLRQAGPGIRESEIEGILARVFLAQGARFSFPPIVASGSNATVLHYRENRDRLREGEVVVMDIGARVEEYAADITRTFPVDGRFSERQAEIYRMVLEAQGAGIAAVRPGITLSEVHRAAYQVIQDAGYGEFFVHGTTHHLGLDVHDVGDLHAPLPAGAVITVEPGVYLPEENIGIRIEDVVLVTEAGNQVLSDAIPRQIDAIEAAMSPE